MCAAEILCEVHGQVAFITLNRPSALNALSLGMIVELTALLERFANDPQVRAVLLRGAGDRAFCAGGDIRALYSSWKSAGSLHREFFLAEYPLDFLLHNYPKPYIVLVDGITMGGGMGLAQGSTLRIAGERTRMAMPEVGIGLFPDVGASYFLSRLPDSLGIYIALTGAPLGGADAVEASLADVYLAPEAIARLLDTLTHHAWGTDADAEIRAQLAAVAGPSPLPALLALRGIVAQHFSHDTVDGILDSLDRDSSDWASLTAQTIRRRSPTMLKVTLRQLQRGKLLNLADCFRMEFGMVEQCFEQGDFLEGVRALIIDKDNAPRWSPTTLAEVTDASVDAFFRARWPSGNHPLACLGAT